MKHKTWNRALSLVMSVVMLVSLLCVPALADEEEPSEEGTITTWAGLQAAFNAGGTVKLGGNITAATDDEALSVSDEKVVTLDLNGYTIDRKLTKGTYQGYVIRVYGTLTVQDTSDDETGTITGGYNGDSSNSDSAGGGIYVDGTLNFNGGTIAGNKAYSGGGVYVEGTMNMNGGKIINNEATNVKSDGGGGVKVTAGKFYMSAGEISNNTSPRYGAGVSVWRAFGTQGYFEMSGGKISGNHFTENAENSTSIGGGIYVKSSNVILKGGEISSNTANEGAGIYLKGESGDKWDSTLTMSNAQISNNTATSSGGGIYVGNYSTVTLQNGNIKGNKAGRSGAGISFGTLSHGVLSGGSITGNNLVNGSNGAGISTSDDVKISGSLRIENNLDKNQNPNNAYLASSNILKVVDALNDDAFIGIANGGTGFNHYAAVGSDYTITERDWSKFSSDETDYAIKPLNTEVEGNRVELGAVGTVTLQSDNVTVTFEPTAVGDTSLTKKNQSTKVWNPSTFVFTVTPAEGYAKTADFSVKCYRSGDGTKTLTANEDGTYTVEANDTIRLTVYGIQRQYIVTFETNGGSDVAPQKMFSGSKVTEPETTREGYTFDGWYSDVALENTWDFDTVVTDDITLYAKWTAIPYTVSGTVTGSTDEDMTDTVVKLIKDNTEVASVKTGATGQFSFSNVTIGSYNIFAEKVERRASLDLEVKENKAGITLQLPDSNIETEVVVDENTPKTTVVGLDDLAKDSKYAPASTSADVVRIVLNVAGKEETALPEETVSAIKNLSGSETLSYLEMDITRFVNNVSQGNITDTNPHLQSITIDFDTARKNISVYRVHNGTAAKLAAAGSTPADGTYRVNDSSITIYATKFSTYAIGYTTKSSGGHSSSSGSATTYPVDVKSVTNGTIKADKSSAAKDSTVTITVTPDKGYELGKLTVTDKNGKTISVTAKGSGQYTFTMPAGGVTVTASFVETDWNLAYRNCPKDSTCPIWPFTDAKTTDWYHDGVHFCLENGLMVGYGNNIFQPDAGTTRAMIAVMLWRLNGSPVVNYAMNFEDVKADAWYTEAIRWAASEGVAAGYGNGKFGPDDAMTREQMVTILWRYAQYKGCDVSVGEDTNILSYDDATTVAQYAIPAMQWACGSGMVAGKTQGSGMILDPKGSTTRAQMATMMMRFCAEIVK